MDLLDHAANAALRVNAFSQDNPDNAAKSLDYESLFNIPATAVNDDFDDMEQGLRSKAAQALVLNNDHLQRYINAHPLHAAVSNDDWHNLDQLSESVKKLPKQRMSSALFDSENVAGDAMLGAAKGFAKGFGSEGLLDWLPTYKWNLAAIAFDFLPEVAFRTVGGLVGAIEGGIKAGASSIGADDLQAEKAAREITGFGEAVLTGLTGFHGVHTPSPEALQAQHFLKTIEPYIRSGEVPPLGVHPWTDALHDLQREIDEKNLAEVDKNAQKTSTGERSPQALSDFIGLETDRRIELPFDAVRRLYGEEEPSAEDGKLGGIPGFIQQFSAAKAAGTDVAVPIAGWIAYTKPEVRKALEGDIRYREGGETTNEAQARKAFKELEQRPEQVTINSPQPKADEFKLDLAQQAVDTIRQTHGLDFTDALRGLGGTDRPEPKGIRVKTGPMSYAWLLPKAEWTAHEQEINAKVQEVLNRIVPRGLEAAEQAQHITVGGSEAHGVYIPSASHLPVILWSMEGADQVGTARHEALHHLRQFGFFTPYEWTTLRDAAIASDWIGKHDIESRYPNADKELQLEEAIAEEFRSWAKARDKAHAAQPMFQKLFDLLQSVKRALKEVFGYDPTANDLFTMSEKGEIGSRTDNVPVHERQFTGEELRQEPPAKPGETFKQGSAIGVTSQIMKRFERLIAKQAAEDEKARQARLDKESRKRDSKQWRDAKTEMTPEVTSAILGRPEIAAEEYLRKGTYLGQKLSGENVKLDLSKLTDEQKASIPKNYTGPDGVDPDQLARMFGYRTGSELVDAIAGNVKARGELGLQPKEYIQSLIDEELDNRLTQRFGDPKALALEEAKDQVLSPTTMDLLHDQLYAIAQSNGYDMPLTKKKVQAGVKQVFGRQNAGSQTSAKYLAAAQRIFREIQDNQSKDDKLLVYKGWQNHYLTMLLAKEAQNLEKEQKSFKRLAKKFSAREVDNIPPEYKDFIHSIFMRVGLPVKRSIQDLQEHLANYSSKTLNEFNEAHNASANPIDVADFLLDANWQKSVGDLTVDELRGLMETVKRMDKIGREEGKWTLEEDRRNLQDGLDDMREKLERFGSIPFSDKEPSMMVEALRSGFISSLSTETLLNHWDANDPRGPFFKYFIRSMYEASNYEAKLQRKYGRELGKIGELKDANKAVVNKYIKDPETGNLISITRRDVMGIIHNWGNESNIDKFLRGWKIGNRADFEQWLHENSRPEDWQRAQKIGDLYNDLFREARAMYLRQTGTKPEALDLEKFSNPHGSFAGWYHPMDYIERFKPQSSQIKEGGLLSPSFFSALPANTYSHTRTGFAAPVHLNSDRAIIRMGQVIHDIAFRETVVNVNKFFKNRQFREMVNRHYGEPYMKMLDNWLKDIVNGSNTNDGVTDGLERVSQYLRQSFIGAYIGFNPSTVMKHFPTALTFSVKEVGPIAFAREFFTQFARDPVTGVRESKFALENSEELQRREKFALETITGAQKVLTGKSTFRENMAMWGAWAVAQSDMVSARPTWNAKYKEVYRETGQHGTAVAEADRAVRRAHGSTSTVNQPVVARGGGIKSWMASIYNFFGTKLQRQIELAWDINDAYKLGREKQFVEVLKRLPDIVYRIATYVIIPAAIEEVVSGQLREKKEGLGTTMLKLTGEGVFSSFVYLRDIWNDIEGGYDASSLGMLSAPIQDLTKLYRHATTPSKQTAGQAVEDFVTALSPIGVPKQIGKTAHYLVDTARGKQRSPQGPFEGLVGLRYGTTAKHPKTSGEWLKRHGVVK